MAPEGYKDNMLIHYYAFASLRYWNNLESLTPVMKRLEEKLKTKITLVTSVDNLPESGDILVAIPLSGAVQPLIMSESNKHKYTIIYAAYIEGNISPEDSDLASRYNAAPTVMDTWAVLHRKLNASIALNQQQLTEELVAVKAALELKNSKFILVGKTEPWVISNSPEPSDYKSICRDVELVSQLEVIDQYNSVTDKEAEYFYHLYHDDADRIIEPTNQDIINGAKMTSALLDIMETHNADAMALACFNLLNTGTNCCLGVSYINELTNHIASCEGDLDSACTMLLAKKLSSAKPWMANPGIHKNGIINFSHCTAPIDIVNTGNKDFILRNHHESGIGTSIEASLPINHRVTLLRISAFTHSISINTGTTIKGERENVCRTQCYIKLDDFNHYLDSVLGCHQIIVFDDVVEKAKIAAKILSLKIV